MRRIRWRLIVLICLCGAGAATGAEEEKLPRPFEQISPAANREEVFLLLTVAAHAGRPEVQNLARRRLMNLQAGGPFALARFVMLPSEPLRIEAAQALARMDDRRVATAPLLIDALQNPDPAARGAAAGRVRGGGRRSPAAHRAW